MQAIAYARGVSQIGKWIDVIQLTGLEQRGDDGPVFGAAVAICERHILRSSNGRSSARRRRCRIRRPLKSSELMDICGRLEEPGGVGWKDVNVGRYGRSRSVELALDRICGQGAWPARFCAAAVGRAAMGPGWSRRRRRGAPQRRRRRRRRTTRPRSRVCSARTSGCAWSRDIFKKFIAIFAGTRTSALSKIAAPIIR